MRTAKFRSAGLVMAAACAVTFSGVAAATPTSITLNPSATNNVAGQVNAGQGQFTVDNVLTSLTSVLDITTKPNDPNPVFGSWRESGALVFNTGTLNNLGINTKWGKALGLAGADYDVYGIFLGQGAGAWGSPFAPPSTFSVTTITSFTIKLYAAPGGMAAFPTTPSSGTDPTGGVTIQSTDLLLGTATFSAISGPTTATLLANAQASTSLQATFDFIPTAGFANTTTYTDGFFAAPIPFEIGINGSGSSNSGQSTWADDGAGGVRIITGANQTGTGNLTFFNEPNKVPTPGTLALVGLALAGAGLVSARRKAQEAA